MKFYTGYLLETTTISDKFDRSLGKYEQQDLTGATLEKFKYDSLYNERWFIHEKVVDRIKANGSLTITGKLDDVCGEHSGHEWKVGEIMIDELFAKFDANTKIELLIRVIKK